MIRKGYLLKGSVMFKYNKKQLLNFIGAFVGNGLGAVIGLLNQILFARFMGVETYGTLTIILASVLLPVSLANFGVTSAIPRFIAISYGVDNTKNILNLLKKSGLFLLLMSCGLFMVFLFGADHVARIFNQPELAGLIFAFSTFIPVLYLNSWVAAGLKGLDANSTQIQLETLVQQLLILTLVLGVWWKTESLKLVIISYGVTYLIICLIGLAFLIGKLKKMDMSYGEIQDSFKDVLIHGLPLNITALGQRLFRRGDVLVVGAILGSSAVGLYQAAYTLAMGIKKLVKPINNFALFYMAQSFGRNQSQEIAKQYHLSVFINVVLALPIYMFLIMLAPIVIETVFGQDYLEAAHILQILSIGYLAFISIGPMGALFNVLAKNWWRMWIMLIFSVGNIILNVLLIKIYGLPGAAYATTLSFVLLNASFHTMVKNQLIKYNLETGAKKLWALAIVFVLFEHLYVFDTTWTNVLYAILGCSIVGLLGLKSLWEVTQKTK